MKAQLRPTFVIEVAQDLDAVMAQIREQIQQLLSGVRILSAGACVKFYVAETDQRIVSPYLSVQAHQEQRKTVLHGRFSPSSEVWTLVMFLYGLNSFLIILGAIFAYGQWVIDRPRWALTFVPLVCSFILAIHVASVMGQRWSRDQMHRLWDCLDTVLCDISPTVAQESTGSEQQP